MNYLLGHSGDREQANKRRIFWFEGSRFLQELHSHSAEMDVSFHCGVSKHNAFQTCIFALCLKPWGQ